MIRRFRRTRRGMVTIALLLALVLLQLVVVGVAHGGARDHDLAARRAETLRAVYAAEAGMNMAIRELISNTDEDADGGIGTISNDGSDASDPSIGGSAARVRVTSVVAGGQITLTSVGRAGLARRSLTALLD